MSEIVRSYRRVLLSLTLLFLMSTNWPVKGGDEIVKDQEKYCLGSKGEINNKILVKACNSMTFNIL
jgi:hypothetical protein